MSTLQKYLIEQMSLKHVHFKILLVAANLKLCKCFEMIIYSSYGNDKDLIVNELKNSVSKIGNQK